MFHSRRAVLTEFVGKQHFSKVVQLAEAAVLSLTPVFIALEKYHPETVGSKSDTILGRFPMRNRFISDYIFEATGKRRTPKQVGSRLQQLRDTCKKDKSELPDSPITFCKIDVIQFCSSFPTGILVRALSPSAVSALQPPHLPRLTTLTLSQRNKTRYMSKFCCRTNYGPHPHQQFDSSPIIRNQFSFLRRAHRVAQCRRTDRAAISFLSFPGQLNWLPRVLCYHSRHSLSMSKDPPRPSIRKWPLWIATRRRCSDLGGYMVSTSSRLFGRIFVQVEVSSFFWLSSWIWLASWADVTRYTIVQTLKPTQSNSSNEVDGANRSISVVYKFKPGDSNRQRSTNTQPLDFPLYPGSPHGQVSLYPSILPPIIWAIPNSRQFRWHCKTLPLRKVTHIGNHLYNPIMQTQAGRNSRRATWIASTILWLRSPQLPTICLLVFHIQATAYPPCRRKSLLLDYVHMQTSDPTTTSTKVRPHIRTGQNRLPTPNILDTHSLFVLDEVHNHLDLCSTSISLKLFRYSPLSTNSFHICIVVLAHEYLSNCYGGRIKCISWLIYVSFDNDQFMRFLLLSFRLRCSR